MKKEIIEKHLVNAQLEIYDNLVQLRQELARFAYNDNLFQEVESEGERLVSFGHATLENVISTTPHPVGEVLQIVRNKLITRGLLQIPSTRWALEKSAEMPHILPQQMTIRFWDCRVQHLQTRQMMVMEWPHRSRRRGWDSGNVNGSIIRYPYRISAARVISFDHVVEFRNAERRTLKALSSAASVERLTFTVSESWDVADASLSQITPDLSHCDETIITEDCGLCIVGYPKQVSYMERIIDSILAVLPLDSPFPDPVLQRVYAFGHQPRPPISRTEIKPGEESVLFSQH